MGTFLFGRDGTISNWVVIAIAVSAVSCLLLLVLWANRSIAEAEAYIKRWAEARGWQLLDFTRSSTTEPFGGRRARQVAYFQFVVCDQEGKKHTGWARFDRRLFGNGRVDIKLDEHSEKPPSGSGQETPART